MTSPEQSGLFLWNNFAVDFVFMIVETDCLTVSGFEEIRP